MKKRIEYNEKICGIYGNFSNFLNVLDLNKEHRCIVYKHLKGLYSLIKKNKACPVDSYNSLQFFFSYLVKHLIPELSKEDFLLEAEKSWDAMEKYRSKYNGSN